MNVGWVKPFGATQHFAGGGRSCWVAQKLDPTYAAGHFSSNTQEADNV
jgi:hypothetical protein